MTRFLDLRIERPVAGGRMLAHQGGRVVLVDGAIPGERVHARVDRERRDVIFATVINVIEPDSLANNDSSKRPVNTPNILPICA